MGTWPGYLTNSIGLKMVLGVCLLLVVNIVITKCIESKRIEGGAPEEDHKIQSIKTIKRLWIGMLSGFILSVVFAVTQFIVRFGYFSLYQEIGAVTIGFAGAVAGGLCGIFTWRRRTKYGTTTHRSH